MTFKAIPLAASLLALSTTFAAAQTAEAPATAPAAQEGRMAGGSGVVTAENLKAMISADELLGSNIYSMNAGYDEAAWNESRGYDAVSDDWEDIGEIDDIVMSPDGRLVGLAVETGGWLDIGDDTVLINLDDVRFIKDGDDFSVVTRLSQEELEAKPQLDDDWFTQ